MVRRAHNPFLKKLTPLSVANIAVDRVRSALAELEVPYEPRLLYTGFREAQYSPSGELEHAFANVMVTLKTPIDFNVRIEVPVPIVDGEVLSPNVFIYAGQLFFLNKKNIRSLLFGSSITTPRVLDLFNNPRPVKFPPAATGLFNVSGVPAPRLEGYPGSLNWAL